MALKKSFHPFLHLRNHCHLTPLPSSYLCGCLTSVGKGNNSSLAVLHCTKLRKSRVALQSFPDLRASHKTFRRQDSPSSLFLGQKLTSPKAGVMAFPDSPQQRRHMSGAGESSLRVR